MGCDEGEATESLENAICYDYKIINLLYLRISYEHFYRQWQFLYDLNMQEEENKKNNRIFLVS